MCVVSGGGGGFYDTYRPLKQAGSEAGTQGGGGHCDDNPPLALLPMPTTAEVGALLTVVLLLPHPNASP